MGAPSQVSAENRQVTGRAYGVS